jgi:SAM-dependent MidA family methyltransferase
VWDLSRRAHECDVAAEEKGCAVGEAVSWREAMAAALYGDGGFFTRANRPGAIGHFRTSAHASPLFGTAVLRLVVAADEALGRPDPLDVVDVGAGGGHLLRRLAVLAPTYLAQRLHLTAVELAPRPTDLPDDIGWQARPPPPGAITGVLVATEWLDNVPIDVAEVDETGRLRYVYVEPLSGTESLGPDLSAEDTAWASQWWAEGPPEAGARIELGAPRDRAWAAAVATVARGLAMTVDYGHMWYGRPRAGTMTGFYGGRSAAAVPDGSRDITAHVAIDAVCAAGEQVAAQPAVLTTQRAALRALGLDATRPPLALATRRPAGYVRALSAATQAAELMDADGLGGHFWIVQPIGVPVHALPAGLRQ